MLYPGDGPLLNVQHTQAFEGEKQIENAIDTAKARAIMDIERDMGIVIERGEFDVLFVASGHVENSLPESMDFNTSPNWR